MLCSVREPAESDRLVWVQEKFKKEEKIKP
jgi:hypothetical protein